MINLVRNKFIRNNIFDTNKKLFAFDNGVYDFYNMTFREIMHDDMISITCGYDYSEEHVDKESSITVLKNISPTKVDYECFLPNIANALSGKSNESVQIIKCDSTNTIAQIIKILNILFGEYMCKINKISEIALDNVDEMIEQNCLRMIIIKNIDDATPDEMTQLIEKKYETSNNYLCMYTNEPLMTQETKNATTILKSSSKNTLNVCKINVINNDFFLLLLEHMSERDRLHPEDKICSDFIEECIAIVHNNREKSLDVYKKYRQWHKKKGLEHATLSNKKFISVVTKMNKHIVHKKGLIINGNMFACLVGVKLI